MNYNMEKIDAIIASQNEKLLANKKVFKTELTTRDGEKYVLDYVAEQWLIEKIRGRTSSYYQLHKTITNGVGKKIEIIIPLTTEEVEYINYHNNNILLSLGGRNSVTKQVIRTRFTYGIGTNNIPYIRYQVLISDRIIKRDFISNLKTEMMLDSCSEPETVLDIVLERITPIEELDDEEIKML